jgi:hypothetical protein
MEAIKIRQLDIGELFSAGWGIFSKNLGRIVLIICAAIIPAQIVLVLIQTLLGMLPSPVPQTVTTGATAIRVFAVIALVLLVEAIPVLLGQLLSLSAIAFLVEDAVEGRGLSWGRSLRQGFSRLPSVFMTQILFGILFFILSLLLVIPGLIFFGYSCFSIYAAALRKTWGKSALDYSANLVTGQGIVVFIAMSVMEVIKIGLRQNANAVLGALTDTPVCTALGAVGMEIVVSLVTVIIVLYFLNNDYTRGPSKKEPVNPLTGAPALPRFNLTDTHQ